MFLILSISFIIGGVFFLVNDPDFISALLGCLFFSGLGLIFLSSLIIQLIFKLYPHYYLTSETLISEEWILLGIKRKKQMNLKNIQQILVEKWDPWGGSSKYPNGTFYFYDVKFDEYKNDDGGFFHNKNEEPTAILMLKYVEHSEEFWRALTSLIPLKPHPTLKHTFQRI